MSLSLPSLFFLSILTCFTLLVAGLQYYLRTRQDALSRRIQELQEHSMAGGSLPLLGGDFWISCCDPLMAPFSERAGSARRNWSSCGQDFEVPRLLRSTGSCHSCSHWDWS